VSHSETQIKINSAVGKGASDPNTNRSQHGPSAPPVRRITVNMSEVKVLYNKSLANWLAPSHALTGVIL